MKRSIAKDKLYKAIGKGERTSHKVSYITKADGTRFRRSNANQHGNAEGGNDYVENRPNRTDIYPKDRRKKIMATGGKTPEEIAYDKEQEDAMFNSQYGKGSTIKSFQREPKYKIGDTVSTREIKFRSGDKAGQIQYPVISGKIIELEPFQNDWVYSIISTGNKLHKVTSVQIEKKYAKGGKTPEEIYEQEQHDAMYDSTYGKGGKTGCWCYSIGGL
jgi:hypothetical protein